ncbi:hypothetical protein ACQKWADRAFT_163981 [Trichoderma austrokoningii]
MAVTLWRTDTGRRCQTFIGHTCEIIAITFSHDSSIMITSDIKRTLRLWQTATGECINVLSVLEFNSTTDISHWRKFLHVIATSSYLRILLCGHDEGIHVLRKDNKGEYKCAARYPAPKEGDSSLHIGYAAASLNSVFVSWILDYVSGVKQHHHREEHWRLDVTETCVDLHVGHQHRQFSYQEINDKHVIPIHGNGVLTPGTDAYAWITHREEPLLWIPQEFRPRSLRHWYALGSVLAIGMNSGTMLIIDFSRHPNTVACKDAKREKKKPSSRAVLNQIFRGFSNV